MSGITVNMRICLNTILHSGLRIAEETFLITNSYFQPINSRVEFYTSGLVWFDKANIFSEIKIE